MAHPETCLCDVCTGELVPMVPSAGLPDQARNIIQFLYLSTLDSAHRGELMYSRCDRCGQLGKREPMEGFPPRERWTWAGRDPCGAIVHPAVVIQARGRRAPFPRLCPDHELLEVAGGRLEPVGQVALELSRKPLRWE